VCLPEATARLDQEDDKGPLGWLADRQHQCSQMFLPCCRIAPCQIGRPIEARESFPTKLPDLLCWCSAHLRCPRVPARSADSVSYAARQQPARNRRGPGTTLRTGSAGQCIAEICERIVAMRLETRQFGPACAAPRQRTRTRDRVFQRCRNPQPRRTRVPRRTGHGPSPLVDPCEHRFRRISRQAPGSVCIDARLRLGLPRIGHSAVLWRIKAS
jgi:hypothetical protein